MENMYGGMSCSSSNSPAEADDISVFVRQILLRSSTKNSSSSTNLVCLKGDDRVQSLTPASDALLDNHQQPVLGSDCMNSQFESSPVLYSSSGPTYLPASAANVSSSSVGTIDDETDDYDFESEDGLVEEAPTKTEPQRSSSKRSRAAEVHNMSEKRRRSRINEKMKALQNLIPNSNKTDKASMLDEAIEYLKQLQLQVQMLTMRNGLSLYPVCLPKVLHENQFSLMKLGLPEGDGPLNVNSTGLLPLGQGLSRNTPQSLLGLYTAPKQTSVSNNSPLVDLADSFGLESSHAGSFQFLGSLEGTHTKEKSACQPTNEEHPQNNSIEYSMGGLATGLHENTLKACIVGREQAESVHLKELERDASILQQMGGTGICRSLEIKTERGEH